MEFPPGEDPAGALRSIEALEDELATLQLELENGECTATAALRERLDKSESWVPSRAYVETLTAAQAILADTALLGDTAQAKDRRLRSLEAAVKKLEAENADLTTTNQQLSEHVASQKEDLQSLQAEKEQLSSRVLSDEESEELALRLRNGEVALQQAKGYQEEVARLQAEKEQLSSKVLSEEELRSWYCVYKTAKWFFDRPGTTGRRSSVLVPCCAMSTSSHIQNERDEVGVCSFWGVGVEVDW